MTAHIGNRNRAASPDLQDEPVSNRHPVKGDQFTGTNLEEVSSCHIEIDQVIGWQVRLIELGRCNQVLLDDAPARSALDIRPI